MSARMPSIVPRRMQLLALALAWMGSSCGLEVRSHTYEATTSGSTGPTLHVAATRTHGGLVTEELRHDAPYRASVMLDTADPAPAPFQVRSVTFEHDGKKVTAHESSAPPLEATLRDPNATRKVMIVSLPLDGLTFVESSTLTITAEVRLPGASDWTVVEQSFTATKEEKSYSLCQRISMH